MRTSSRKLLPRTIVCDEASGKIIENIFPEAITQDYHL